MPVVWVALLFPGERVTDAVTAAPPLVLVSNISPWHAVRTSRRTQIGVQAPVLFPSLYGSNGFPVLPSLSSTTL